MSSYVLTLFLILVSQWIASKSCSSASCSATSGHLYDPSSSQPTGVAFTMQYLSGTVSGPIVWDQVQIGGYIIPNQALAAATSVNNEPLSYNFDGILGLALPLNSLIQQSLPASTGDAPDGAAISSNLFSLTTNAPSQPFFSLTLARPGSSQIPSLLGIGRHPPEIVPDPSHIRYSSLVGESVGALFWKTTVRAITVYVNGQAFPVALQSLSGTSEPTALLDSGVPLIVTTPALANGIYGALGIDPAPDGNYYVPCATPLNMTITLDGQNELSLHPLDLTTEPAGQSGSQYCTGLIQTNPSGLAANSDIGDMVLGVPFMRNVYTVMAYEQPDATGNFNNSFQFGTHPMLGLLGLTNASQAMEEFDHVRVLKQPLGNGSQQSSSPQGDTSQLSVGVKILIGLAGFFALCLAFFALRCFFARRRWRGHSPVKKVEDGSDQGMGYGAYQRTRSSSRSSADQSTLVHHSFPHKDKYAHEDDYNSEFGMKKSKRGYSSAELEICDPWDPHAGTWRDTIIGTEAGEAVSPHSSYIRPPDLADLDLGSAYASPELTDALLMAHDRDDSPTSDLAEFGVPSVGMAGIGTAARGSIIDLELQHARRSYDSVTPLRQSQQTVSSLRSSHTLTSSRESVSAPCNDADRTF
ncbi:aspartic peptidase domain-containing protein [Boletus coccyginus]|nr:aspartic peptidase domain-containing protein [Boletus coccyginus]